MLSAKSHIRMYPDSFDFVEIHDESKDGIDKASQADMNAYSVEVARGGSAATMLKDMVPKPVKAVEDPNAMAAFIEDMSSKT